MIRDLIEEVLKEEVRKLLNENELSYFEYNPKSNEYSIGIRVIDKKD